MTSRILKFVKQKSGEIWPGRRIDWDQIIFLLVTPRFKASRHVVFLLFSRGNCEPLAIVKMPRIPGDNQALDREVEILNLIDRMQAGLTGSIPRVLAYEDHDGSRLLVEEAMPGTPMGPRVVRRDWPFCTRVVLDWLCRFQSDTLHATTDEPEWFRRTVLTPLDQMAHSLPLSPEERRTLGATKLIAGDLGENGYPLVFTHGDLSSPNILLTANGRVSVVDWELAEPKSLPALDLFLFLTYIAFARDQAQESDECLASFRSAFSGPASWTAAYISGYSRSFGVQSNLLRPLLVMTWARYLAGLTSRLLSCNEPPGEVLTWLRGNRYYKIWTYMIEHYSEFRWLDEVNVQERDVELCRR